jgi:hypothetical protein
LVPDPSGGEFDQRPIRIKKDALWGVSVEAPIGIVGGLVFSDSRCKQVGASACKGRDVAMARLLISRSRWNRRSVAAAARRTNPV